MPGCTITPNCSASNFEANPDIAGPGVIAAFLVSAWLSVLVITFEYLFVDDGIPWANPLDRLIIDWTKKLLKLERRKVRSLQPAVLMVSDQQLVTGLSILAVGFITHCTISQYHFYIVTTLGTISFIVHQTSIDALRVYLHGQTTMKLWRVALMTLMLGLIIVATDITSDGNFSQNLAPPTQCIWDTYSGGGLSLWLVLLLWNYVNVVKVCFPGAFHRVIPKRKSLDHRESFSDLLERLRRKHTRMVRESRQMQERASAMPFPLGFITMMRGTLRLRTLDVAPFIFHACIIALYTVHQIFKSEVIDLWLTYMMLGYETIAIYQIKALGSSTGERIGSENVWGFGQILALLLLILPLMSILDVYYDDGDPPEPDTLTNANDTESICLNQTPQQPEAESRDVGEVSLSTYIISVSPPLESSVIPGLGSVNAGGVLDGSSALQSSQAQLQAHNSETKSGMGLESYMYGSLWFRCWILSATCVSFILSCVIMFVNGPIVVMK
ncbi:hypothetical protein GGR56DRAFT_643353 [Xylariaceae sp. FL0804]|nr:hypothetical protein GGR56DRAFT_643353 [Xylariaceae sp. FL0804]